jgi:hypothetical protein
MRLKMFCCVLLLLMLSTVVLYAQPGEPCAGADPDTTCPLDAQVSVLAFAAVIMATAGLYQKQKAAKGPGW